MNPSRRPTVRIVKRRSLPRAAVVSLVMTTAAAAVAFAAWRWWQPPPVTPVVLRTVSSVELTYRCESGHSFPALGQVRERHCPTCSKPAYAVTRYDCRQHGSHEVAVQFGVVPDGGTRAVRWRMDHGEWTDNEGELVCPRCLEPLVRRPTDVAETAVRSRKKSGG